MASSQKSTHFGFRDVEIADKTRLVGEVFDSVAAKYDVMNDLMSFGVHHLWKRYFVQTAQLRPGSRVLDLAGGTGDVASLVSPIIGPDGVLVLADINASMLQIGRDRMLDKGLLKGLHYAQVDAEALPFASNYFDCITMAFGLRNVTRQQEALASMYRVLKPGGRLLVLEFSEVKNAFLKGAYDLYSFKILPRMGKLIANDAESYRYLAESIRKHPNQETLKGMMEEAGFESVDYRNMTGGIAVIHSGYKF